MSSVLSAVHESHRKPLVVCIASMFALSAPISVLAIPTTWPVSNCNSSGPGSLREVIAAATTMSGDTVDMSGLPDLPVPCSTITLTVGEIYIDQLNLKIKGPGASKLIIDGTQLPGGSTYLDNSRLFTHTQAGSLTIEDVTLSGGHVYHNGNGLAYRSLGGCVSSQGNVTLTNVHVASCSAVHGSGNTVLGGGVYAKGSLTLDNSTLTGNTANGGGTTRGGGAYAHGVLSINHSTVTGNSAIGSETRGGGLYALDNLIVKFSDLAGNTATANGSSARGGAARSGATLAVKYSTVSGNSVFGPVLAGNEPSYKYALGGGLSAGSNAYIRQSTVSNNYSNGSMAGVDVLGGFLVASGLGMEIYSSTISGNHAQKLVGGVFTNVGTVKIRNSTIAFNTSGLGQTGPGPFNFYAPGLAFSGQASNMNVILQSTIVSNNYVVGLGESDLTTTSTSIHTITFDAASSNNLARAVSVSNGTNGFPVDTRAGCPLLGTLRDNGGLTWTHALMTTSAAIDFGSNPKSYLEDQRGVQADTPPFLYPRESKGVADIGAYEVNQDEIVFGANFEGCPVLE